MGFFKSFFSGKPDNPLAEQEKTRQKNFDIFKYDGIRAQRMGRQDYAINSRRAATWHARMHRSTSWTRPANNWSA